MFKRAILALALIAALAACSSPAASGGASVPTLTSPSAPTLESPSAAPSALPSSS
jgi:ABC-type glycerol-3-phosphate transport system substrate-binding protein